MSMNCVLEGLTIYTRSWLTLIHLIEEKNTETILHKKQ